MTINELIYALQSNVDREPDLGDLIITNIETLSMSTFSIANNIPVEERLKKLIITACTKNDNYMTRLMLK